MGEPHRWPEGFDALRSGEGCPMCATAEAEENPFGNRILEGEWCDAYLGRAPIRRGYCYTVWKGRHACEPTELTPEEAAGFWAETARVARAVERRYEPVKMNWMSLGNGVPHLHVHLVPRYEDDPMAGGPIEDDAFATAHEHALDDATIRAEAAALRALIDEDG